MLTRINRYRLEELGEVLKSIRPDEVQLNLPLRSIPAAWERGTRGETSCKSGTLLKPPTREETVELQNLLANSTGLKVVSIYQR
jgi:hypothetical protein